MNIFQEESTKTLLGVGLVSSFNLVFTFLFYTLLLEKLGQEAYGEYFMILNYALVISGICDLGLNISAQKYFHAFKKIGENGFDLIVILYRSKIFILFCILSLLGSGVLQDIENLGIIAGLAFVQISFNHVLTILQIKRDEKRYIPYLFLGGLIRLVVVLILPSNWLDLFIVSSLIFAFPSIIVVIREWRLLKGSVRKIVATAHFRYLFKENIWLNLATLVVALYIRMDFFVLETFGTAGEIGIFSSAFTYCLMIPPLVAVVSSTLLVRIASFESVFLYRNFARIVSASALLGLIGLYAVLRYYLEFVRLLSPEDLLVFTLIYVGIGSTLIVKPFGLIIHFFDRDRFIFHLNGVQLVLGTILSIFSYENLGVKGVAISFMIVQLIGNLFVYVFSNSLIKNS